MRPSHTTKNPGRFRARAQFAIYGFRAPNIAESAEKVNRIVVPRKVSRQTNRVSSSLSFPNGRKGPAMLKFLLGTTLGVVLAFAFVRFNLELPAVFDLPEKVKKNVVSAAVEGDLYDLARDAETRSRALEIYFKNRAGDAVKIDAAAGHPFLAALYRARATREARTLAGQWTAYDKALAEPALRGVLQRKHGLTETDALRQAMLLDALDRKPFLKSWLERDHAPVTAENLRDLLAETGKQPAPPPAQ
jgi:hypothetical protein